MRILLTVFASAFLTFIVATDAWAPPVFSVPSGGRGLENAKQAAQITQIKTVNTSQQTSIDTLTTQMATVQPHAKATMNSCAAGNKILWDGTVWTCVSETDPTVQAFAKSPLPTCAAGQMLKADGTNFSCVNSAGAGFETDPTVYAFAKSALPNCSSGNVLTGNGTALSCVSSGSVTETDPTVTTFAKAALPNCTGSNVLTGNGTSLSCTNPAAGFSESDPVAKTFAKTTLPTCGAAQALTGNGTALSCSNISGAGVETDPVAKTFAKTTLPTCGAGQALKGDGTTLTCVNISGAGVETDPKIGTLTNTKWCTSDGTTVSCATNAPVLTEVDPKVGTLTNTKWCTTNGTTISCTTNAPVLTEADPKVGTVTSGYGCYGTGSAATCADSAFFWDATNHRLGVGLPNPGEKLEVNGNIKVGDNRATSALVIGSFGHKIGREPSDGSLYIGGGQANIILQNNVGIGTTAPVGKLTVANGQSDGTQTAANAGINFTNSGGWTQAAIYPMGTAGFNGDLVLATDGDATQNNNPTEKMRITSGGNVGIGTTSVGYKLDVNGSLAAPLMYDKDNAGFYVDPNNVSLFSDIRPSIIYDRDNTGYYIDMNNTSNVNALNVNGNLQVTGSSWINVGANAASYYICMGSNWLYYGNSCGASDQRLKQNIEPITGVLNTLDQLRGVRFDWKDESAARAARSA